MPYWHSLARLMTTNLMDDPSSSASAIRRATMATYLIESPHTAEECLRAMDEVLAQGSDVLARYNWGCGAGVHSGWVTVEAATEVDARRTVPTFVRSKAHVVQVGRYTPEQ